MTPTRSSGCSSHGRNAARTTGFVRHDAHEGDVWMRTLARRADVYVPPAR